MKVKGTGGYDDGHVSSDQFLAQRYHGQRSYKVSASFAGTELGYSAHRPNREIGESVQHSDMTNFQSSFYPMAGHSRSFDVAYLELLDS